MKRLTFILTALFIFVVAQAQQDSIQLQEIVVKGARVTTKADRSIIHPSDEIVKASTSGYNLISRLALPGIRVDETNHSIISSMNDGEVQLRINDIAVGKADMLSIDMTSVESIEYIDNPGVRYGEGIAKVINIKTRRAINGYNIGTDLGNALTAHAGSNMVYAKLNRRKNEFSASYTNTYKDLSRFGTNETASYLLSSGETKTIIRSDTDNQLTGVNNQLQLNFNRKQDGFYQFQAKLTGDFSNNPTSRSSRMVNNEATTYATNDKSCQPTLDLYYDRQIDSTQAIRLNAVGTYINSNYNYANDEGQAIAYGCDGRTYSLISEAIYENHLHPSTLSAGVNYQQKYVSNNYMGSVLAENHMRFSNTYAFAQLSGKLFKRLSYVAGIGATYIYFHQDEHRFDYTLLRPKLTLQYPFDSGLKLRYSVEMGQHISQIANTSDILVRTNSMEMEMGNPNLRPNKQLNSSLRLSIDLPRLSSFVEAFYRCNRNVNLDKYTRIDDCTFIHSQRNQDQCTMFYAIASANWYIIPEKLSIGCDSGIYRFFNFGDDYRHRFTAYNWQAWVSAYLGKLSLSAYADNGFNFMEGEHEGHQGHCTYLSASYRLGDFNLSLRLEQPFESSHTASRTYLRNRYVSKSIVQHSRETSNFLYLSITWNISHGKQYKGVDKRLENSDRQTGIMKM